MSTREVIQQFSSTTGMKESEYFIKKLNPNVLDSTKSADIYF
jgi:hypothetical protein